MSTHQGPEDRDCVLIIFVGQCSHNAQGRGPLNKCVMRRIFASISYLMFMPTQE